MPTRKWGTETLVNTTTAGNQRTPAVTTLADGGYVIEIRSIRARGKLDAAYLNPRPINVSQATAPFKEMRSGFLLSSTMRVIQAPPIPLPMFPKAMPSLAPTFKQP